VVEPNCNISCDFEVLALIFADGNKLGVIKKYVCCLKSGVGKEACRHKFGFTLCTFVFELGHAAQFAERDSAFHYPAQLAVFGNMALNEDCCDIWIEPNCKQSRGKLQRLVTDYARRIRDSQGM
jgi:hypothetical protein